MIPPSAARRCEELKEGLIRKEVLNQQDNVKFAYKPQYKKLRRIIRASSQLRKRLLVRLYRYLALG